MKMKLLMLCKIIKPIPLIIYLLCRHDCAPYILSLLLVALVSFNDFLLNIGEFELVSKEKSSVDADNTGCNKNY